MRTTGLAPAKAFEHERAFLVKLPSHLPPPYRAHDRVTDQYGYAAFEGNYYFVPGTDRAAVRLLEYADALEIHRPHELLARYPLPPPGTRGARFSPEGTPRPRYGPARLRRPTAEEEKRLRGMGETVSAYLDFACPAKGPARHAFLRTLHRLSQQLGEALFGTVVARALQYRVPSLEVLRRIAVLHLGEGLGLPPAEVDDHLEERESYRQGHLTDAADLSAFEGMLDVPPEEEGGESGG